MRLTALLAFFLTASTAPVFAQGNKPIEHADVHRWRKIEQQKISNNGQWVAWAQSPVTEGDATLHLWDSRTGAAQVFERASEPQFSDDSKWLVFRIKPALDTLKTLRRKKVKDEDLPKDSLGIFDLQNGRLEKIARLKTFALPEKWNGWLLFQCEPPVAKSGDKGKGAKPKKEDKENGSRLFVRNLGNALQDTIAYVKEFVLAKKGARALVYATGQGDTLAFAANPKALQNGVYLLELERSDLRPLYRAKGKFQQLALDESGQQAAFLADLDTTKARVRPWQLAFWESGRDTARLVAGPDSGFLPKNAGWGISEHTRPVFSEDSRKLYFGMAPPPVLNDTTLLKEEIVEVEVWAWTDKRFYTQEKNRLENEKKRAYPVVFDTNKKRFVALGSTDVPEVRFQPERNAALALGFNEEPYAAYITWEGTAHKDLYAIDLETGAKKRIVKDLRCNPRLSPLAQFICWWSDPDTAWFAWSARTESIARLTDNRIVPFYQVDNDVPDYPNEYGLAGWLRGDEAVLLYDQFDIWKIDPQGKKKPQCLTQGRETGTTYRYIKLDPEERSIAPDAKLLLHQVNKLTKAEGYAWLDLDKGKLTPWLGGDFAYSRTPLKAQKADKLLFTKENFQTFPDLRLISTAGGGEPELKLSDANPQQGEYSWGSIELYEWTSLTGGRLQGLLVKPAGFDPKKTYPMVVNFYEKLSDELNRHRSPDFHRSQINYTVYASRGYLVFAPDIPYQTGYPGESAYNAIMSGVLALVAEGFVDSKRVALQGHSWGGYQAAYLVTRTDFFACAEAGAPVANMTSAYGGVRWESGLSRSFQYERQQSRIGGSLWEKPKQYWENSPLFSLDRVKTPLLILHNDKDGAVPWYQGIELFNGLRRLQKPAWMLNYNDEPHWPVKLQNRVDFQRRMQQFFDHYLLGAPMPPWMQRGVPPMEKGILQGLE